MSSRTTSPRARILFYEPHTDNGRRTSSMIDNERIEVVDCEEGGKVLEQIVETQIDTLVFDLTADHPQDLGLLRLIRRAAPDLPLVVIAPDDSLAMRREIQAFQPIYYAVVPIDPMELSEAVTAALLKSTDPRAHIRRRAFGH